MSAGGRVIVGILFPSALAAAMATSCGRASGPHAPARSVEPAHERILDAFDAITQWTAHPSDGVALAIEAGEGRRGPALRLDFDFHGGGGYAIARRALNLKLPENYEFTFWIRGDAPVNNLEFKLIDPSGENVWWLNQRAFEFPSDWRRVTIKKRHIEFAWGPAGGGDMEEVAALELAITAGSGGAGTVWVDELGFRELEPVRPYDLTPLLEASSSRAREDPARAHDQDAATAWHSAADGSQSLTLDFQRNRELGGLIIDWDSLDYARDYRVEASADAQHWEPLMSVRAGNGGRGYLFLPETETRLLRLTLTASARGRGYGVRELVVQPLEWSASRNAFFEAVARDAPRGSYPRYLLGELSYWTVVGQDGARQEALISEDGMVEIGQGGPSIEPFLYLDGHFLTWNDAVRTQSLAEGYLPIPSVRWEAGPLRLSVTAAADGTVDRSTLHLEYLVENNGSATLRPTLFLTLRPFQVNPSSQFLNVTGGFTPIDSLTFDGRAVRVSPGAWIVVPIEPPAAFGASSFQQGGVIDDLRTGGVPDRPRVSDEFRAASGALAYRLELEPGDSAAIHLVVPLDTLGARSRPGARPEYRSFADARTRTTEEWREKLDRVQVRLPPPARYVEETLRSTLAYILINRDGPAIQPGSRAYTRSWIRDGALTSAALLRFGHPDVVREFIDWYAPFQYANGKIPCCVDWRGADPVPEHDSTGEFIFLVAEYYRQTGDRELLERMWPHILNGVAYLDSLRQERMTAEYRKPGKCHLYGLLPESISHEGYSAKPVHSYWDDFFALKGLKDAAAMAEVLGKPQAAELARRRDDFRADLMASLRRAMELHGIDYLPGSADLGDFDPSATTVALEPAGELARLPQGAVERTFDRYYEYFIARRDGRTGWENFTPYEMRLIGTFVRLGWKERAHELLEFFMEYRRPPAWNGWAEVVWPDPRALRFIGDMPHTWVGSDFLRSAADMIAYEREEDQALVVGAGLPADWVESAPGVSVKGFHSHYGSLDVSLRAEGGSSVRVSIAGDLEVPPGGIVLMSPLARPLTAATVNGRDAPVDGGDRLVIQRVPADVVLRYESATRARQSGRRGGPGE